MKGVRERKVNGKQFAYILDCINVMDEKGNIVENVSDKEKIQFIIDEYCRCNHCVRPLKFEDFISGLPTGFDIDFCDYEIREIGKSWGFCQTERKAAKFVTEWFSQISNKFMQLANILGCDTREFYQIMYRI